MLTMMHLKSFASLFFCLILSLHSTAQVNQNVYITGRLVNFDNRTAIADFSELADLRLLSQERELVPDKNGRFSLKFPLKEPNYFLLGRNILYLSPGDKLDVVVDYSAPLESSFHGTAETVNNYLKTVPSPHAGSYLNGGLNLKKTIKETVDNIVSLAQQRRNVLTSTRGVPGDFVHYENARIDTDI
ncbi:MAG: hypothetical protein EOP45_12495, partial [Sphingobacteriaceae bacterium]